MPAFDRAAAPRNDLVVAGGTVGIDGSTFKLDVLTASLSLDAGLIDDTGAGDTRRKWLSTGSGALDGSLSLRGWLIGDAGTLIGLANLPAGTELAITLTLQGGHTVEGYVTVGSCSLGATKATRRGIALGGKFAWTAETHTA